jgi:hypothetical protein
MITSVDEAKLLLNKWISSSTSVVAVFAMAFPERLPPNATGFLCRLTGKITGIDATGTFVFAPESGKDDFLIGALSGCGLGYSGSIPSLSTMFNLPLPKDWDSALYIVFPNTATLVLFAAE